MARCTKCNHKWSFKDIAANGFSKEGKECPSCKERQYISTKTQGIMNLGGFGILIVMIFPSLIKLSDKKDSY